MAESSPAGQTPNAPDSSSRPAGGPAPLGLGQRALSSVISIALLPAAVAMGFILQWLAGHGWYFAVITPALATLPVAYLLWLAMRLNPRASAGSGAVLGVIAGVLLYGGYYQAGLSSLTNERAFLVQTDVLPGYIRWRMQTSGPTNVPDRDWATARTRQEDAPTAGHWALFGIEAVVVLGLCVGAGVHGRATAG